MTSVPQIKANQANAQLSTGPVSAQGKEKVSQNATRHGLTSTRLNPKESVSFEEFLIGLTSLVNPKTEIERALVRRCAEYQVKIDRALAAEAAFMQEVVNRLAEENEGITYEEATGLLFLDSRYAPKLSLLMRYQAQINRGYRQTKAELEKLVAGRLKQEALIAELQAEAEESTPLVENGSVSLPEESLPDQVTCNESACEVPVQNVAG